MENIAGWIAPIATVIAAMMTAANLGARITGWGFIVFVVGSVCWSLVGLATGQTNLLATNAFLTIVNLIGVWRWLGRQRAYEDGGKAAAAASRQASVPTLFTASGISGMPVEAKSGEAVGHAVEALIECQSGEVNYVVVASGGLGGIDESLRAVPRDEMEFRCDRLVVQMSEQQFLAQPALPAGKWPADAKAWDVQAA